MSEGNGTGILKLGRKGKMRVQFGDNDAPFEIDVIGVTNTWSEIDRQLRDDKNEIPREKIPELNNLAWEFVKEISSTPDISLSDALAFMAEITKEGERLKSFFSVTSEPAPSSRGNTELIFST